jgi:hypothetical protein
MSFDKLLTEDRRLMVLRLMAESPDYQLNVYVLRPALDAVGHTVGLDRLESDLAWLAEQGLVSVGKASDVTVGKLTARGADVAAGRAVVPGVKRPEPEA